MTIQIKTGVTNTQSASSKFFIKNRINYLDGHRGLAILLVIGYHAYARWSDIVPYGNQFSHIPLFSQGSIGVQLFFLISGFVILMTLNKCQTFKEFVYRRWLRLFPAMFICSILIFMTATIFHERPAGIPKLQNLLPGLTFIEPLWWQTVFRSHYASLDGAFWTLYIEFKFYIFAACIYFWRGQKWVVAFLFGAFALSVFLNLFDKSIISLNPFLKDSILFIDTIINTLSFKHFGWFAAGSAFYIFSTSKDDKWFYIALFISLINSVFFVTSHFIWKSTLVAAAISIFFALSIISPKLQFILSQKVLLFFGFVSYPLYLIHQNMMISMIVKLGNSFDFIPSFLLPIPPILFLALFAYLIAKYLEPLLKNFIKSIILIIITSKKLDK